MDKLKSVLSGGSRKSDDTPAEGQTTKPSGFSGEGTHLGSTTSKEDSTHPIYDQFTGHGQDQTTGASTKTTGETPHFSNSPNVQSSASPTTTSSLSPNTTQSRPTGMLTDEASTASIRSGVIGFGQSKEQHAALPNTAHQGQLDNTQVQAPASQPEEDPSHHGRDAALGAGAVGAGAATAHELSRKFDNENLRSGEQNKATAMPTFQQSSNKDFAQPAGSSAPAAASQQHYDQARSQPETTSATERSFPLAGGVTSRKQVEPTTTTRDTVGHPPVTSEREPGTKEREAGVAEGHGREGLAGAAAGAAAAYATHPHSESKREQAAVRGVSGTVSGAPTTSDSELKAEHDLRSGHGHQSGHASHNPVPVAAAVTPSSATPTSPSGKKKWDGTWKGKQEVDSIDPCDESGPDKPVDSRMFTSGPHSTDTANRYDPHLHVPGEFPETPMETSGDNTHTSGGILSGSGRPTEARSVEPSTTQPSASRAEGEHNYSRDAALGAGALGAGTAAYEADKHHQHEHGNESLPTERSPYSTQQIDPRVDARQPGGFDEQRSDPSATRNAAPTGTHAGPVGTAIGKPSATTQRETTEPPTSNFAKELSQDKDHHYGRDAALAGGAATAGGLAYAATQRDDKSQAESGPASSTIGPHKNNLANVLDPRVQPDPALQKHHQTGPTTTDPANATVGPHKSNVANVVDPRVLPDPEKQKGHTTTGPHQSDALNRADPRVDSTPQTGSQHHYGRDAALGAAGAGTAAETAHHYGEHRSTQPSASMNDQRYDPTAQSAPAQRHHEPEKEHHYGRDAALGGGAGAGAAGLGALAHNHANKKNYEQPFTTTGTQNVPTGQNVTHPSASGTQNFPTTQSGTDSSTQQHHHGRDAALAGGAGAGAVGLGALAHEHAYRNKGLEQPSTTGSQNAPTGQTTTQPYATGAQNVSNNQAATQQPTSQQHHYGRDAAIAGGAGAAGVGAYELGKNRGVDQPSTTGAHNLPSHQATTQPPVSQYQPTAATAQQPGAHQRYDSVQKPGEKDSHKGRDAAAVAGVAGTAGAGAYAYDHEKEAKEAEKAQKAHEKELEKQQKQHQKELDKNEKAFHADQKKLEKQHTKEEKEHNKLVAAENKKHEHETKQAEKEQEKESHKGRDAAAAAGVAGATGAGAYAYEHNQENKEADRHLEREEEEKEGKKKHGIFGFLHRDKSKKSPSSSPRASSEQVRSSHDHPSTTAAAYEGNLGDGRNKLHKDPPEGHPARDALAGGAGTHGEGEHLPGKHEHIGVDGPIGNPDMISGDHETRPGVYGAHSPHDRDNLVTEPHTGLQANTDKYGVDGSGGVDGSETVPGLHKVGTGHHGVTDWDAIKKADTPY